MARGAQGGGGPPRDRQRLREALALAALTPGQPQSVPFDYSLYRLSIRTGVPAWVYEGYPRDEPPLLWLVRIVEFDRMESSVSVRSGG